MSEWTFITNHGAVFAVIAKHPEAKALDIALEVGVNERSVRRIIADLLAAGYISVKRKGWYNQYSVNPHLRLRRDELRDIRVKEMLSVFSKIRTTYIGSQASK